MANIINNQFNSLRLEINYSDYWDFFLNNDSNSINTADYNGEELYDGCLISYIDATDSSCFIGDNLIGKSRYIWGNAKITDTTLYNVGLTAIDNGLIPFERDKVTNKKFIDIFQNSELKLWDDGRLRLHPITSPTKLYEYPFTIEEDKIKLNGGFYQGFFETDCSTYQILPSKLENGDVWQFEFVLNKTEFKKESDKTLNDNHPNNKGIFFYLGTRAENKWIYLYDWDESENDKNKLECFLNPNVDWEELDETVTDDYLESDIIDCKTRCCSYADDYIDEGKIKNCEKYECVNKHDTFDLVNQDEDLVEPFDYIEGDVDVSDFEFKTKEGILIGTEKQTFLETDNKFLMFDRTCQGLTTSSYEEGDIVRYELDNTNFKENLFLLMDRTCNGYTTDNIDEFRKTFKKEYDVVKDIVQNALAFRITDNGEIGYRYIVTDCESDRNYKIIEGYSKEGIIKEEQWYTINVRLRGFAETMIMEFYVDGKLVFLTKELPKLNLRKLDDIEEKQETVPYNISLGGGTQGLSDTILLNYMSNPNRIYPLEEFFGGSFIGYIKRFRFYNCKMSFNEVLNNYKFEFRNY